MSGGATARLVGLTLLGAALAVAGFAAPAAADVTSPPGPNTPPAAPGWIAFQLSSTNLTLGSTVQVSVAGGSTVGAAQFFTGPDWPGSWSGDGLTLQYQGGSSCDFASHPSSSCAYTVTGNSGTFDNVLFGAGSIPPDQVSALEQTVTVTTPTTQPTTPPPPPSATFTGPPNGLLSGGPGQFQFQSPNQPGVTYTWTLLFNGQQVDKQSGPTYTPPSSIFTTPGQYTLTLSASDGAYPNGVTSQPVQFEIPASSNPTPTPSPAPTPAPSPTPAAPPPAVSPPAFTHLSTVSYVPLSNFDVPTPAAIRPVTVIWLWRPDWFQTAEAARTAGRPSPAKRASVSIDAKGSAGPSATPWLAGLATFGIFGFVWILVRRRRVRTSILD
jgi:PKD domain